ncbi:MAG: lipopolysaccharide biosynthesis protein [Treponema sp.]|nr:lipopolysaccharide biosynthesis protein [Treponema sp.]
MATDGSGALSMEEVSLSEFLVEFRMLKKIFIYGAGTFFSKILVFLMIPVYTRILSPADYGYYDVLLSNIQLLATIAFMEVWSGIIRFMFDSEDPYVTVKTFVKLFPLFISLYAVFFFGLSLFFDFRFPVITFCYGLFYVLFYVMNSVCRGLGRNVDYVISGAISTLISCLLSFIFLVVVHKGVSAMFLSLIAGYACSIAYVELRTHAFSTAIRKKQNWKNSKEMLSYCFPLMINTFSYSFLTLFNKNVIMSRLGDTDSGYYALAEKIGMVLSVGISIYMLAWQEEAYIYAKDEKRSEIYSYHINQYVKCVGLLVPLYMFACYFVMPFVSGENFSASLNIIPLLIVQVFIGSISGFLVIIISAHKKSKQILISMILGAVTNTVLMTLLIPVLGIHASNVSLCIGLSVCSLARYLFARQFAVLKIHIIWVFVIVAEFAVASVLFRLKSPFAIILSSIAFLGIWFAANYKSITAYVQKILYKGDKK